MESMSNFIDRRFNVFLSFLAKTIKWIKAMEAQQQK